MMPARPLTLRTPQAANAPAVHFDHEPFRAVAFRELAEYPLAPPGICMNPCCSLPFAPTRDWQRYCSPECRRMDEAEMRRVGQIAAPALLAWRMGRDQKTETPLRALSRAGRNFYTRLSTDWFNARQARVQAAQRGQK
jgi:hypothetical protein